MSRDARTRAAKPDWDRRSSASTSLNGPKGERHASFAHLYAERRGRRARPFIIHNRGRAAANVTVKAGGFARWHLHRFARRGDTQTRAARRGTCLTGLFDPLMRPRPPPGLRHANRRGGVPALSGTRAVGARGSCSSVPCTVPVQ